MSNSNFNNYANLNGLSGLTGLKGLGGYGAASSGHGGITSPSATVLAKVDKTLQGQSGAVTKLNTGITRDQAKLSGLGQLQGALAAFQSVADRLGGAGLSTNVTTTAKQVATATAGNGAQAGQHTVDVKQLAQSQQLTSGAFSSASGKIGTGAPAVVKIEFGTAGEGGFTAGKQGSKALTIDSSNNTLEGIAAAFKAAGIDASVVKSGSGAALSIQSASGAAGSLRISVSGDAAIKDLLGTGATAAGTGSKQGLKQTAAAQDAIALVDGKEFKSATNTLEGAIKGVSLGLTGAGKADVAVTQDSSQITRNVSTLVSAYNDLSNKLTALGKSELKSDPALAQASRDVGGLLRNGGATASALAQAGVTVDGDGKLKLDEKQLSQAIAADPEAVSRLFTNQGKGLADQLDAKIDGLTAKDGVIGKETGQVSKDLATLNTKKTELAKALTAQANALVQLYTAQEQAASGDALPGYSGPRSLFDFLA